MYGIGMLNSEALHTAGVSAFYKVTQKTLKKVQEATERVSYTENLKRLIWLHFLKIM